MEPENEIWFYEKLTGRRFKTTLSKLKECVFDCTWLIYNGYYVTLSDLLGSLGVEIPLIVGLYDPCLSHSDGLFETEKFPEVEISTKESCDGKPVYEINFHCDPK